MTLQYVFHKTTVLLYATVMLLFSTDGLPPTPPV